ncbi:MAG: hypothetical protein QXG86_03125 [Candidatus Woesearchaeota archaeon]
MGTFEDTIIQLQQWGVVDVLLPFLLFFTVIFAILQKIKILGEESKKYNVIVALVMALAVVIPHVAGLYPPGADIVDIVNTAIPNVAVFFIAIILLFLLVGLWGAKPTWEGKATGWVAFIAALIVIVIFARAAGWGWGNLPDWLDFLEDPATVGLIVVVLVFIIVVAYITSEPKSKQESTWGKVGEEVGKLFGKK